MSALGVDATGSVTLDFEARFSTGLRGTHPHLDVAITLASGAVVAVESKFTEHLDRSTAGKGTFAPAYFPDSGALWEDKGLAACQVFAEELNRGEHQFEYLDPWQLLKHALGLAHSLGDKFSLYYLYYDCRGAPSESHKLEVLRFAQFVGEETRFKALTYQDAYSRLVTSGKADGEYIGYLGARYFVT